MDEEKEVKNRGKRDGAEVAPEGGVCFVLAILARRSATGISLTLDHALVS